MTKRSHIYKGRKAPAKHKGDQPPRVDPVQTMAAGLHNPPVIHVDPIEDHERKLARITIVAGTIQATADLNAQQLDELIRVLQTVRADLGR